MSEISHELIDKFFKERPQLKPPPKGMFGYKIDRRWFDLLWVLLNHPASITPVQGDARFDPVCRKCGDPLVSYELVCDDCRRTP